ncbi:xanthine dehydrogenase accessory protein XdhC [Micrococcales bacterium 31B]|nr:xanthine dehydrogenase accessory protein XdhC [Micrococcales bacterium 31B]
MHRESAAGRPVGVVTVLAVRGHAPCAVGAKMVVTPHETWGTVGGGLLERRALARVRESLASGCSETVTESARLGARGDSGGPADSRQCCGGEVTYVIETWAAAASAVALFGMGHVGLEVGFALSRSPIHLYAIDSRVEFLRPERLDPLRTGRSTVYAVHAPIPEAEINSLPPDTHIAVMTHDHAEDLAIIDQALRRHARDGDVASIGVIGSRTKWSLFARRLLRLGHDPEAVASVDCPFGAGGHSKDPATIGVSIAATLLQSAEATARHAARPTRAPQRAARASAPT